MDASVMRAQRNRAQRTSAAGTTPDRHPLRVLVVDDHVLFRQAVCLLLTQQSHIVVVGEADNGRDAVAAAEYLRPDVVLLDLLLPALNGLEALQLMRKRAPQSRVLMVTAVDTQERIIAALGAGAAGYVAKQSSIRELLVAIDAISQGNVYVSEALTATCSTAALLRAAVAQGKGSDPITAREREILQLLAEGFSNQGSAEQLCLSVRTVEAHKGHIMHKLGLRSQTDLIRYALRTGIAGLNPVE